MSTPEQKQEPVQAEMPLSSSPQKSGRRPQRFFKPLLFLALLVIAGSAGFYSLSLNQRLNDSIALFTKQLSADQKQVADLQDQIGSLQQRLQQQQEDLQQAMKQVGQGLLPNGSSRQVYSSVLSAKLWVELASEQLLLGQNAAEAQRLLAQAQTELHALNEPEVLPLKKALEEDQAKLKNLPATNTADLFLRLSALQKQIQKLPLQPVPAKVASVDLLAQQNFPYSGWEKAMHKLWDSLRQIVVVYRLPNPETPPFITPEHRPYIYQNLYALLNEAAWALLNHDETIYRNSLQQASDWLGQYFYINTPETQALVSELQALQALPIQPAEALVLSSPQAFQAYLNSGSKTSG